ncbi:OX-2 membrane glycoprotein-like [Poeciliopsis prolifica]|uniref:OX-2 membrane glycoprotein-like n=1 Tax=Poeciliopsis prolifica TaxID=188132 RepID=UPI00241442BD|nr:OX-2 membrane glycoprotein-like [Poeciliopsis prolifica]
MQRAAVTSCLLICSFLQAGHFAVIETQETVWAAVGDQASLSCRLTEDKDVLQITWQKVGPGGEKNLATYTKKFGSRVSSDLEGKMDFQYESVQRCSMVIRKVTHQDEGCYRCLFNTYPEGALIGWTCLKLCELLGPFIDVSRSDSPPGSVVTCSATGRPVPIVTLTVLHQNLSFSHYNTSRVINTNGTITSTITALLSALNTTQVGCSVSLDSAALRELLVIVPGLTDLSDGLDEDFESDRKDVGLLVAIAMGSFVLLFCIFGCLSMLWFKKSHQNRKKKNRTEPFTNNQCLKKVGEGVKPTGSEDVWTGPAPVPPAVDPTSNTRNKTISIKLTNEVKQRHSTKKSPARNNLTRFPSVAKKLFR